MASTSQITPVELHALTALSQQPEGSIIDVRAPSEFALDHLPGAINLPVLSDPERVEVGTIYKQQSPFAARKIGGAMVAQNTAVHLRQALAEKPGDWCPLVYCWRGGQRSNAFATILSQVGWRVQLLNGGYRSYRRLVVQSLYNQPLPHQLVLLDGGTGTAKTALLKNLGDQGAQILDLERLAQHRGSLFGALAEDQPSQKMFESGIAMQLAALDPGRITWIEAESSKIGARIIPPSLWSAMQTAPSIRINAPVTARASYLCDAYADLMTHPDKLRDAIDQLRPFHAAERIEAWQQLVKTTDWHKLAESLMQDHYDPRYAKSAQFKQKPIQELRLPDLTPSTLRSAAATLIADITPRTLAPARVLNGQ